jgi:two-component system, OmpR family, phosphate regulon sensor histidine kinase PhoR
MKRIYSIIILLITVSLLGIIIIQVNWIKNAITVKEEQFKETAKQAILVAGKRILAVSNNINSSQLIKRFQANPFHIEENEGTGQRNFLTNINAVQIREILKTAFKEFGLTIPQFEFSVSCDVNDKAFLNNPVINTPGFYVMVNTGKQEIQAAITPESGSEYESLVAPGNIWVIIPNNKQAIVQQLGWMIAGAILFTSIIIAAFYLTLSTLLKQKKISEIKSDFINNMTHEFKTPLATISLAVDALKNEKVINNPEKMHYFTDVIKEENKRMNKQVETILQAALLDKQEIQLNLRTLNLNEIVNKSFEYFKINLEEKNGVANLALNATQPEILGDEVHLNNLVRNLMDNAIKYSKPDVAPKLFIKTLNKKDEVLLVIEDNGIGMTKETLHRIFEKFYRAHTGNVHNVKGFGLGLSYVKAIVDAHKGKIKADSTLNQGSTFTVSFPAKSTM